MRVDPAALQRVVESIAVRKLEDNTWELDMTNANQFVKMVSPYVTTAAKKSNKFDPEGAAQDVLLGLWKALKRYGPTYQGKPFAQRMLPMKTNNVLTNEFKKRNSKKSRINFISESYDYLTSTNEDDTNNHEMIFPCSYPADLTSVAEAIPEGHTAVTAKKKIQKFFKLTETLKEREAMPQVLSVDDLFEYTKRLNAQDKRHLFLRLWALFTGMSERGITKALTPLFNLAEKVPEQLVEKMYNPDQEKPVVQVLKQEPPKLKEVMVEVVTKAPVAEIVIEEPIKVEEPKIQPKPKKRIRLEFSENVEPAKQVIKKAKPVKAIIEKVDKYTEEEYRTMLTNFKQEDYINIIEGTVGKQYLSPYGKKIQMISKTGNRVRVLVIATDIEKDVPGDYRVIPLDLVMSRQAPVPMPKVEIPTPKEEKKEDNELPIVKTKPVQPVITKTAAKAQTSQLSKGSGVMHTPKQKRGTAVDLVIHLLQENPQTKEDLATAIIQHKLTKNTKIENVVNYVSVMFTKIKKKYNLKKTEGKYSIASGAPASE